MTEPRGTTSQGLPLVLEPLAEDLARVGEKFEEILSSVSQRTHDLIAHSPRFAGKRLRPALTCLAGRIAGGGVTEDVASVAAIVELVHTATASALASGACFEEVATQRSRIGS